MTKVRPNSIRRATLDDCHAIGRLLHGFNREYDDPTPAPEQLARRFEQLLRGGDTVVLLGGEGPDGIAVLRFRDAIWSSAKECYLAELYVVPDKRGQGLGRALMDKVLETARAESADHIDLNTEEGDTAARALYESLGFTNTAGGERSYYYERELGGSDLEIEHPRPEV